MENPVGLLGIEFVEFTGPSPQNLVSMFEKFGFKKLATHKTKDVQLFRQNEINFILNNESASFGEEFKSHHGPSICAMGWKVKDAKKAFEIAVKRGARAFEGEKTGPRGWTIPAVYGIGDSLIYFVDRPQGTKESIYDLDFNWLSQERNHVGTGYLRIDHLTNNVPQGEMQKWCDFYTQIFGFEETKYFDIKGKMTGLISKVMASPCGTFSIPINESSDDKSQIAEYIREYNGSGIQHLAFLTTDILTTVAQTRKQDIEFLAVPDTYYDLIESRGIHPTEPISRLKENKILVDGDEHGYLLQIFTKNLVGPIFIEVIQRKNHKWFGEGNFQALFDAMEMDQVKRGVL